MVGKRSCATIGFQGRTYRIAIEDAQEFLISRRASAFT
jgi:hypothetical protein